MGVGLAGGLAGWVLGCRGPGWLGALVPLAWLGWLCFLGAGSSAGGVCLAALASVCLAGRGVLQL